MATVRDEVKKIIAEVRGIDEMTGAAASEYAYKLAAWLQNIGEEIWKREVQLTKDKVKIMSENKDLPMTKIETLARDTENYGALLEAKYLHKAAEETIRTLKYRMRTLEEEFKTTK